MCEWKMVHGRPMIIDVHVSYNLHENGLDCHMADDHTADVRCM